MAKRERTLAGMGVGAGLALALLLGGLRLANTPPPQLGVEWPGLVVFTLVYAAPFILALVVLVRPAAGERAPVWLAAAGLAGLAAFTSFSGLTLLFLPAAGLLGAAAVLALGGDGRRGMTAALVRAGLLVVLGAAGWWLLLAAGPDQGHCWRQVAGAGGSTTWQAFPFGQSISVEVDAGGRSLRSLCTSDIITPLEAGLALLPLLAAAVLVWRLGGSGSDQLSAGSRTGLANG